MLSISDKDYFETKIRHFVPTKIFKNQGKYLLFCPKECSKLHWWATTKGITQSDN